jgi:hypothetical protein
VFATVRTSDTDGVKRYGLPARVSLYACVPFGLLLAGFSLANAAATDVPAPKTAGRTLPDRPIVSWLQPSSTGCTWSLYDPEQGQTRKLTETPTCPSRILWDRRGRRAFYERDGRVWELAWDSLAQPRNRAPAEMPMTVPEGVDPATATDVVWWISHTTRRLRAGRSLPLVGEDEMGDEAPRSVEYEGKRYPMAPLPSVVRHPIFGAQITAIALVWELSPQGQWERIAARGTRIGFPRMDSCDDVDCGGHNVIRERMRFRDGLYAVADSHDPRFGEVDPVRAAAAAECDASGRCSPDDMNLDEKTRVLFESTSISGHELVGARVALCLVPLRLRHRAFDESKCAGSVELVPDSVSWSPALQRSGPYGLLVDSRNASRPLLVAAGRLQAVWSAPRGKLATWLPWRELWELAR